MYELTTTVRKALGAAPEGMCIGISDYSAQELRAVACIAKVERMINAFFDAEVHNPFLINPNTNEKYPNPEGDLHCLAAQAMYPELQKVDKWNVLKESKLDMGSNCPFIK